MLQCRHSLQLLRRPNNSPLLFQRLAGLKGSDRWHPCAALGRQLGTSSRCTHSEAAAGAKSSILRRVLLGSFCLTLGAMPFSMSRRAKASAAELTAGNVRRVLLGCLLMWASLHSHEDDFLQRMRACKGNWFGRREKLPHVHEACHATCGRCWTSPIGRTAGPSQQATSSASMRAWTLRSTTAPAL